MEEGKRDFPSLIRDVIISKLNLIDLLIDQEYLVRAEQVVDEITEACDALSKYIRLGKVINKEISETDVHKNNLNPLIKNAQRHLGRLEDYVIISDQKKVIIEIQKLSDAMEELKKYIANMDH